MKKSVVNGVFWSAVDRFAVVAIQVIFEILLARLLLPSDYGLLGMVAVFIAIAHVFVDGGFMNALIQKQDRSEKDYSTVFVFSLVLSIFIYLILFFAAPVIAAFYDKEQLIPIVRVLGLNIVFNSIALVYRTKLSVSMDFKLQAKFSVFSVLISGVFGLVLAYLGFGVWALVLQLVTLYGLNTILLMVNLRWIPKLEFSMESFKQLFGFGSKLLLASVINAVYTNLYQLLIGKVFNDHKLGLYTKSSQFTLYPSSMMTNTLQRVMYPFLSQFQDDDKKLFELNKQYYLLIAMIFFPLFFGLSMLAEPFVRLLLTDVWIEAVPLIRILSLAFLLYPLINVNMFVFQIKGMPGRFLFVEILTKVSGIIILIVSLRYNLIVIAWGILLQYILQLLITSYMSDKALKVKVFTQIKLLMPLLIFSSAVYLSVNFALELTSIAWIQLFGGMLIVLVLYSAYYVLFMKDSILFVKNKLLKQVKE